MRASSPHSFHIPVMGLAFTIDTPLKVAKFGISSVVSIIEDQLIEQMREVICKEENMPYVPIKVTEEDSRAKRITAYLNLLDHLVNVQMTQMKEQEFDKHREINQYFEMLPDSSLQKKLYRSLHLFNKEDKEVIYKRLKKYIVPGSIDVNIMTKLDKTNYDDSGLALEAKYSDALAALRGYANSNLCSSIVFSAGLNPRLFNYCEQFLDFYPNENGVIKKKIILKVSDYRSALIQGKYLAKKGLWISEFRIESGINCGGHTFISNGILLGPILEEFKHKRKELFTELEKDCANALLQFNRNGFTTQPEQKITVQGGIGTAEENEFLRHYYDLDATGWGSPFLLVPEATNVDDATLKKLANAKQNDFFLSHASPLGVPFQNFRPSSSEEQRKRRIEKKRAGSPCYKKFLVLDMEFTGQPICTASRQYQKLKTEQLTARITDKQVLEKALERLMEKDCLCEGLGASALLKSGAKLSHKLSAVTICPGPNLAYFSGIFSLKQMVDHIYGRISLLNDVYRPHMFINELQLYVDYLKKEVEENITELSAKAHSHFLTFKSNLLEGVSYYDNLFKKIMGSDQEVLKRSSELLALIKEKIIQLPIHQQIIS